MSLPFELKVDEEFIDCEGTPEAYYELKLVKNSNTDFIPTDIVVNLTGQTYLYRAFRVFKDNEKYYNLLKRLLISNNSVTLKYKNRDGYPFEVELFLEPEENVGITKSPWIYKLQAKANNIPDNKKILDNNRKLFMKGNAKYTNGEVNDVLRQLFPSSYGSYKVNTYKTEDIETHNIYECITIYQTIYVNEWDDNNEALIDLYYESDSTGKRIREISKKEYQQYIETAKQHKLDLQLKCEKECQDFKDYIYRACLDNSIYDELKDIDLRSCISEGYFDTYVKKILSTKKSEVNLHKIIYDDLSYINDVNKLKKHVLCILKIYFECLNLNESNIPIIFGHINKKEIKDFPFLKEIMEDLDNYLHTYIKNVPKHERTTDNYTYTLYQMMRKQFNNETRNALANINKEQHQYTKYFKVTQENVDKIDYVLLLNEFRRLLNKHMYSTRSIDIQEFNLNVDVFEVVYYTFGLDDFDSKYNPDKDPNDPDNFHNFSRLKTISETYNKEYPDKQISCKEVK